MKTILSYFLVSALTLSGFGAVSAGLKSSDLHNSNKDNFLADTLASLNFTDISLPKIAEEGYVDDIPFNTNSVSAEYFIMILPKPEEEAPVDDFPFDTRVIADRYLHRIIPEIAPEPEEYIEDIPFNTALIAKQYLDFSFSKT